MKAASINEIKKELLETPHHKLVDLCLRLSKFKKENKELLTFLLFESHNIDEYIQNIKNEIDYQIENINKSNVYFIKKSLRKILRITNKHIRYSASEIVEIELLIHFLHAVSSLDENIFSNKVIHNLYQNQYKKLKKSIENLHEDLQYDYLKKMNKLFNSQ